VVVEFLVVVALNLVEPELDIGDFGSDGVHGGIRPAGEIAHCFCGVYMLGSGGLVDGERIIPHGLRFDAYIGDFGYPRAPAVTENDCAVAGEALVMIGRIVPFWLNLVLSSSAMARKKLGMVVL